jgi:type VI protein secretion system component VasK
MTIIAAFTLAIGIIQIVCLAALFWGLVELRAMQKSTHSIQYIPADESFQKVTDAVKESLSKDLFDNVG